jgi:hypothetical protein
MRRETHENNLLYRRIQRQRKWYSDVLEGWQWRMSDESNEYFADSFLSWVYGCWERNDTGVLTSKGIIRSNFMSVNMPVWIYETINNNRR